MRVYFVIYCTPFDMVNNNFFPLSAIYFCMCFYFTLPRYLSKETSVLYCITSGDVLITFVGTPSVKLLLLFSLTNQKFHFWFSDCYKWITIMKCMLLIPHGCHHESNDNFF